MFRLTLTDDRGIVVNKEFSSYNSLIAFLLTYDDIDSDVQIIINVY